MNNQKWVGEFGFEIWSDSLCLKTRKKIKVGDREFDYGTKKYEWDVKAGNRRITKGRDRGTADRKNQVMKRTIKKRR